MAIEIVRPRAARVTALATFLLAAMRSWGAAAIRAATTTAIGPGGVRGAGALGGELCG